MGQESLLVNNLQEYKNYWEEELLVSAEKNFIEKHYKVEQGYKEKEREYYMLMTEVFNNDKCELAEWAWKKINGFFEDPEYNENTGEVKSMYYQPIQNIYNTFNNNDNWNSTDW